MIEQSQKQEQQQEREREQEAAPRFRVPFGEGIRRRRHAANLTAAELAKMVGVVESTITRMEQRAAAPISRVLVKRVAAVLGVSVDELLGGTISADLLTYSDPVTPGPYAGGDRIARPLPRAGQVLVPHGAAGMGDAEGLLGTLMADAIALEQLAPQDLAALVRVSGAMRRAAEAGVFRDESSPDHGPHNPRTVGQRKERQRVRHTRKEREGQERSDGEAQA